MRAIGASGLTILRIVIGEGVLIGAMSWTLGVLLGLPLGRLLSAAIGRALLDAPLSYTFATDSALLWLGVVLGLAALASFIPAWTAARQTVHSALAYEG
jgi:putative ABC transport system permease protein